MSDTPDPTPRPSLGGVFHTYRGYDPATFPPPTAPPSDGLRGLGDEMVASGGRRRFTAEELAEAIRLPPEALAGLGPSIDAILARLESRKDKILATWNPAPTAADAARIVDDLARPVLADEGLDDAVRSRLTREIRERQIHGLERLWYLLDRDTPARGKIPGIVQAMADQDRVEGLRDGWPFRGRRVPTIEEAFEIREELEAIDRLLEQLKEALRDAKPVIVDLEELREFVEEADLENFAEVRRRAEELLRQAAEREGLVQDEDGWSLGPSAMRKYQQALLASVFDSMQGGRHGRHDPVDHDEGVHELPSTRPWEFGDPLAGVDLPASILNCVAREASTGGDPSRPAIRGEDLEVHKTRATTKCATVVIMDMSGSMRWGGQYVACKKMAMALEGLVRREYPGDRLHFMEMYSVARVVPRGELMNLLPKPVTINDPVVRLRADMSDPDITEQDLPPHFTNIQHALRLARRLLANADTPNRQIVLITDGLPTAHFEDDDLFLLYPPDPRTEAATMREAALLGREGGVLNVFLVPSWSQNEEDVRFAHRLAESTSGRVVFTGGEDLDRFVIWDYLSKRRQVIAR
ncbi:MAG: VWA domain-containing protein [Phycisphaeraceae bacterium]|nr:VWA domain-containing protein [Phycisphaeraceae bacterium]MDG1359981.1 VWA domain-containing protein [Phycisphaerales bacterium]